MKKLSGSVSWNNLQLDFFGISHVGQVRKVNEDDFLIMPEYRLFCVADGMGGHDAGDVASRLTLESIANYLDTVNPNTDVKIPFENSETLFTPAALEASIQYANTMVHKEASGRMMGATIVAGQFLDDGLEIAHAGDSRIYQYHNGRLNQLTEDHSLVNDLYLRGEISKQEMREHPQRNIITRAVGSSTDLCVATQTLQAVQNNLFLFCSDGLTSMLEDEEIEDLLGRSQDLTLTGEKLIQRANEAGGRDNVTILLVKIR